MSIYITGDTHGDFDRVVEFCAENGTTHDDVLIVLGDAGLNYWLDYHDDELKKEAIAIGSAYSIDKYYRLRMGIPWFETEQPSEDIMEYVESQLEKADWRVDYVLTHTAPMQYEPVWAFIPGVNQERVDKTTEKWLDSIEQRLDYDYWYCGHYHVDSYEGPVRIMFEDFDELN